MSKDPKDQKDPEEHVDNFELFRKHVSSQLVSPGDFFPLLIMTRKKDSNDSTEIIATKYIYKVEDLDLLTEYIKKTCIENNARCYIKINKRNEVVISENMVRYIVDKHLNKEYKLIPGAYSHIVGVTPASHNNKLYLIDVDDISQHQQILEILDLIKNNKRMQKGDIITVKTKNGLHLLVPPFDIETFKNEYCFKFMSDIVVNKDGDSLLFY